VLIGRRATIKQGDRMTLESHHEGRRRRRIYATGIAAGVAFALAGGAHAQQDTSTSAKKDADLEEIIVTANKREEKLQDIGEGISVVSDQRLDQLAANSLADYIQDIPGVNLQSFGATGYGTIEIRGISPQSVGSTASIYIDDIPVSASSAGAESALFLPDLDPADIQSVQVLKGPQGTLYGASSLGGVIKYVTKQPSFTQPEANLTEEFEHVQYGDYGGKIRASASTPLTDDLAVRVSSYYRWTPGYIDDVGLGVKNANNGYDWGLRGTLVWKPTSDFSVNLNALEQWSRQNGFNTVDYNEATLQPVHGDLTQFRYLPELFVYKTNLYSAEIKFDQPYGSFLSASSYNSVRPTFVGDSTAFYVDVLPPGAFFGVGPTAPYGSVESPADHQLTEELRFTSNRLANVEFLTGLFFQHESLDETVVSQVYEDGGVMPNPSIPPLGYQNAASTLNEYAGFFNATYYIVPNLDVTFGYRYSDIAQNAITVITGPAYFGATPFSDLSTGQTSHTYLGGARWHITDDVLFYLRAASGYRPGGPRSTIPGAPADFSLHYNSDNIWSYESGVKLTALGGRLTVDTDLFWIDWNNIQTLIAIPSATGESTTQGNGGHALSRGAEIQATYVPIAGLSLRGNLAYTDAFFKDAASVVPITFPGQRLYYVPELKGGLSGDYTWPIGNYQVNVGGDWSYTGDQYDLQNTYLIPSYSLFNARAGVKWGNYNVNFYARNVADKRAIVGDGGRFPMFPTYPLEAYVNQPRTVGVQFSQHF
jgi:iron complex outermembrane recepter protein